MSYKHFDIGKGVDMIGDEETFFMLLGRYKEELHVSYVAWHDRSPQNGIGQRKNARCTCKVIG